MKSIDHEECTDHESVMRGVCFCPSENTVYCNPQLWREGITSLDDDDDKDIVSAEMAEILKSQFFECLEDTFWDVVGNSVQMPGMLCECKQMPSGDLPAFYKRME